MNSRTLRIAKNTAVLYFRTSILVIVSLFASRVVLEALGIEDFGIYSVVGGIVAMFSIMTGSLSATISRFITFELGRKNKERLQTVFSTSIAIQVFLSVIVILIAEFVGVWFLNNKMNIPPDRIVAANYVFQFSLCTFVINLISVPYNAVIIAHERMKAFAYISVLDGLLKLAIAYCIELAGFDKLIVYAALLALESLLIRGVYGVYCLYSFDECASCKLIMDRTVIGPMVKFSGWNMIGASSGILRVQGINILLNIFFGTAVNAAQGIANQVNSAVTSFVSNFTTALNPPITKSYASDDKEYMITLTLQGARFSYYLLLFILLPVLLETNAVLFIWLKVVPPYTAIFVRLVLIFVLCETLSSTLITAMLATGNIRNYQILVGSINLLNLPLSYVFLHLGYAPPCTLVISIFLSIAALMARLMMLKTMIGLSIGRYFQTIIVKIVVVTLGSSVIPCFIYCHMESSFVRFIIVCITSAITTPLAIYTLGLKQSEKTVLDRKIIFYLRKRI